MNLGEANLKTVNASKPRLIHVDSKQSITASDDYYSLSSSGSSQHENATVRRYETPPLQSRSATSSRNAAHYQIDSHPLESADASQLDLSPAPTVVRFGEDPTRKPGPGINTKFLAKRTSGNGISPPTPGVDDTPYIRFAIDQLTRDEELLGSRGQGASSESSYPVDRIIPDEGLGYLGQDQYSVPQEKIPSNFEPAPIDGILLPAEPNHDMYQYPTLHFVPTVLRPLPLLGFILCCCLLIAALIFCNIWSTQHNGLWQYNGVGSGRYFLFEFLPQLLAMVIVQWLFVLESAIQRILPFSVLALGHNAPNNSRLFDDAAMFLHNLLIPNLAYFRCGEPVLTLCFTIFWLSLFTIPLQSCLFQTRFYENGNAEGWRWTAVRPVGWTLIVLYVLLVLALILVMLRFHRHPTGLKWDPVSLADIVVLFHGSNILSDFQGSEVNKHRTRAYDLMTYRLGYWVVSDQPDTVFYGIGKDHAAVQHSSTEGGKMKAKSSADTISPRNYDLEGQVPLKTQKLDSLQTDIYSPSVRYRWVPWFLQDTFIVAWIVIAIVLMFAFIIGSFVRRPIENGFLPLLPAPTTAQGFSPANFLYSFLPSLLGTALFLFWQPIDQYFRASQPFASLATPRGTNAGNSLLLDYNACLPFEITVKALLAKHYKVAYISFISLLSTTLPILAGGVFTAQFFVSTQDVRIAGCMPAYTALTVFVAIYALSFLLIWPTHKRRLPHDIRTLRELISFMYQSPLLSDPAFKEPRSKVDLVTRLVGDPAQKRKDGLYAFGVYAGRDGKEHLGIDRLARPGSGEMMVTTGKLGK